MDRKEYNEIVFNLAKIMQGKSEEYCCAILDVMEYLAKHQNCGEKE